MPTTRAHRRAGAAALAIVLAAGCAATRSGQVSPVSPTGGSTSAITASAGTGTPQKAGVVVERDNSTGTTVRLRVGDRIELILSSDYWTVHGSSKPAVLRQDGHTGQLPPTRSNCPPGVGCRPVYTYFTAVATGTAVITAHRDSCGEARRCVGSEGRYTLNVIVG